MNALLTSTSRFEQALRARPGPGQSLADLGECPDTAEIGGRVQRDLTRGEHEAVDTLQGSGQQLLSDPKIRASYLGGH